MSTKPARLCERMATAIRVRNYSPKTRDAYQRHVDDYCRWLMRRNGGQWLHPDQCGSADVCEYCTWLATVRNVAASTQNQALAALLFLYRHVLGIQVADVDAVRAKKPTLVPQTLAPQEIAAIMQRLKGQSLLIAQLLYGCGMRIGECVSLRIKDVDLIQRQITVHHGKGGKSRLVGLPAVTVEPIRRQIEIVSAWYQADVRNGCNRVELPYAFARKSPKASGQLAWYWLFSSHKTSRHPTEGWTGRYHIDPDNFGRSLTIAANRAGIHRRVKPHMMRHSYATHQHAAGVPLGDLQQLMGHAKLETTRGYIHVDPRGVTATASPLDRLPAAG